MEHPCTPSPPVASQPPEDGYTSQIMMSRNQLHYRSLSLWRLTVSASVWLDCGFSSGLWDNLAEIVACFKEVTC